MIQKLFFLVPVDAAGRTFIEEGVTFRHPFEIEGNILGFYGTLMEKELFERLNHNNLPNINDSI
jgi:hypothetical protein